MPSDYEQFIIDSLFETYSKASGFKIRDIKGKRRTRQITKVRHEVMQQIRLTTSLSYSEIGKIFNRTHGTVLYACNKKGDK
jgi:chromosomal replication initiation ATPase DnaA